MGGARPHHRGEPADKMRISHGFVYWFTFRLVGEKIRKKPCVRLWLARGRRPSVRFACVIPATRAGALQSCSCVPGLAFAAASGGRGGQHVHASLPRSIVLQLLFAWLAAAFGHRETSDKVHHKQGPRLHVYCTCSSCVVRLRKKTRGGRCRTDFSRHSTARRQSRSRPSGAGQHRSQPSRERMLWLGGRQA